MSVLHSLRQRLANALAPSPQAEAPASRRDFFRHAAGAGAAALGAGLLIPDDAWAAVEDRASRFGITPGTVVDAQGRPVASRGAEPLLGEIMLFGGNFAPRGFALCHGQLLPISSNSALFSILGTIYGGDGRTTFALPDLRGRAPIQEGRGPGLASYRLGERGGQERVTLTAAEVPPHSHGTQTPVAEVPRSGFGSIGNEGETHIVAGHTPQTETYSHPTQNAGGGQAHENRMPYLAINFCIALQGIFPSRS